MNSITLFFILFTILSIVIYDIWALLYFGYDGTITAVLIKLAEKFPALKYIIPFIFGLIIGHLFL